MLINLVFLFGTFTGTIGFQWTSSWTFPNGTLVNTCLGGIATFPWSFSLSSSEQVADIEWYHVSQNQEILLAVYVNHNFLPYGDSERRLSMVLNAGLQLTGVTSSDIGQFSIRVNLNGGQNSSQTAFLQEPAVRPNSCLNVKEYDDDNRVHTIYPNGSHPVKVYCDQTTDNGGWTVIQRRQDGSVDFYRNWTEYESGFGNPESEYWIGLANLHLMTSGKTAILRVDLMDFNGSTAYAMYNTFNVSGPEDNYRLTIDGYNGTAGDSLQYHNNMQFSTYDKDHDLYPSGNCAASNHGAWWYNACSASNLNGRYYSSGVNSAESIWWFSWHDNFQSIIFACTNDGASFFCILLLLVSFDSKRPRFVYFLSSPSPPSFRLRFNTPFFTRTPRNISA